MGNSYCCVFTLTQTYTGVFKFQLVYFKSEGKQNTDLLAVVKMHAI